jgi:hypothetical protein
VPRLIEKYVEADVNAAAAAAGVTA